MRLMPGICNIAIMGAAGCRGATASRLEPVPSQTDPPKELPTPNPIPCPIPLIPFTPPVLAATLSTGLRGAQVVLSLIHREASPDLLIYGDRIGKLGRLVPACDAVIFNSTGEKVLLTRRTDNSQWCLPGGAMDPGESASECCAREVLEETGLVVSVGRLIGVYSTPHRILEYADGNRKQALDFVFEAVRISGELSVSDETTEAGYFSPEQMKSMDVMELFHERINDAFARQEAVFLR